MAVTNDVINSLYGALAKMLGVDIDSLQQSLYAPMESALSQQKVLDTEKMKDEMASRGVADSGVWLEALNNLDRTYASQYENASNNATSNAYNYLLNSVLAANSLGSTILGNNLSQQQLNAYLDSLKAQEDASLWGGIGSLLGGNGVGSGLIDLISSATSGLGTTIKSLLGTNTTTNTLPTTYQQSVKASNTTTPYTSTYVSPSKYNSSIKQSVGQGY